MTVFVSPDFVDGLAINAALLKGQASVQPDQLAVAPNLEAEPPIEGSAGLMSSADKAKLNGLSFDPDPEGTPPSAGDVLVWDETAEAFVPEAQSGGGIALTNLADCEGNLIGAFRVAVVADVSGSLTTASHSGKHLITSGNVTIPNAAGDVGFTAVIQAGGAHTVTFNSTTTAALAAGDLLTVVVTSTSTIIARKSAAADQVAFT